MVALVVAHLFCYNGSMDHLTLLMLFLTVISLLNSTVALTVSIVSVFTTMTLLRYARREQTILDQILNVCRELGTAIAAVRAQIEFAIWKD